jgi:hypothetical protein
MTFCEMIRWMRKGFRAVPAESDEDVWPGCQEEILSGEQTGIADQITPGAGGRVHGDARREMCSEPLRTFKDDWVIGFTKSRIIALKKAREQLILQL